MNLNHGGQPSMRTRTDIYLRSDRDKRSNEIMAAGNA